MWEKKEGKYFYGFAASQSIFKHLFLWLQPRDWVSTDTLKSAATVLPLRRDSRVPSILHPAVVRCWLYKQIRSDKYYELQILIFINKSVSPNKSFRFAFINVLTFPDKHIIPQWVDCTACVTHNTSSKSRTVVPTVTSTERVIWAELCWGCSHLAHWCWWQSFY